MGIEKVPVLVGGLRFLIQWELPLSVELNGTSTYHIPSRLGQWDRDGRNGSEKGLSAGEIMRQRTAGRQDKDWTGRVRTWALTLVRVDQTLYLTLN
jgi:hypothetical protein